MTTNKVIEKCTKVLAPGLLRIETEPIDAYFKNNRVIHRDYLKVTKEHVETLQELLEQARALKPSDENLDYAYKFAKRIQELLVKRNQCRLTRITPSIMVPPEQILTTIVIPNVDPSRPSNEQNDYSRNSLKRDYVNSKSHPMNDHSIGIPSASRFLDNNLNFRFLDCRNSIMGYGDLQAGNILISQVYYVEGLSHNLFLVGQFCDSDLKVAFRKHSCFNRYLDCVDLLSVQDLVPNQAALTLAKPPSNNDLDLSFQPMFDEYFKYSPSDVSTSVSAATLLPQETAGDSSSTTIN
ncbi:hypothetical protein Tco_0163441 [Tanacetum coccineum]